MPKIGDYVLATKYSDGDSRDVWYIGYIHEILDENRGYILCDEHGVVQNRRFRRCGLIHPAVSEYILYHRNEISSFRIGLWNYIIDPIHEGMIEAWEYEHAQGY